MAKETFLFVPYSASSGAKDLAVSKLTSSDARSHAAAVSRSRRDNRKSKLIQKPSIPVQQDLPTVITSPMSEVTSDEHRDDISTNASADGSVNRQLDRRQHMRAMQFSWRAASNGPPSIKTDQMLSSEPTSSLTDSPFGRSAIKYFHTVLSPHSLPIYDLFNVTNAYTDFYSVLMSHDGYKNAGIALAGALMHKASFPGQGESQEVQRFQASAVTIFRNQYAQAMATGQRTMDDVSILTVSTLAQLARFLGNISSYQHHRTMIKEMVKLRGGLDALGHDGLVEAVLRQWDMFWTYEGAGDPLFPEARTKYQAIYPVFPLDTELRNTFLKVPPGFQNLVIKGLVSIPTIDILGRVSDFGSTAAPASAPKTYKDFATACPCLMEADESRNCFEKQICLAVLLYCFNTFLVERTTTSLYAAGRTELTRLLLKLDEHTYAAPEQEALLWACAVCMDSWRTAACNQTITGEGPKLMPVVSRLAAATGHAQISLRKFFLCEPFETFCREHLDHLG